MRKFLIAVLLTVCASTTAFARGQFFGYVQKGGNSVVTGLSQSSTKVQQSYPGSTVSVYISGTATLATLYSDSGGTPKANPFTASTSDSSINFFTDTPIFDITFSGKGITTQCGSAYPGYPCISAFTWTGMTFNSSSAATTVDVTNYGALCDGTTDDTSAINTALSSNKHVTTPSGRTCVFTQLTIANTGTTLQMLGGSILSQRITTLTGTVTLTNGSASVTGVGTHFTTELAIGQIIFSDATHGMAVLSITNDTLLTLTVAWPYAGFSGTAFGYKSGILVTGTNVTLLGPGHIQSPSYVTGYNDTAGASPKVGVVYVTNTGFQAQGVTFDNVPRIGVFFKNTYNGRVADCTFNGNFAAGSYDSNHTTLNMGIIYDPPSSVTTNDPTLVVVGNSFSSMTTGVGAGNYDGATEIPGMTITGNNFDRLYDHGVYAVLANGASISGNTFLNCKVPIVASGYGVSVTGNGLYTNMTTNTVTTVENGQQIISVRDCIGCVISGNTLRGLGPGISLEAITAGAPVSDNIVSNNVIDGTTCGVGCSGLLLTSAIRVCYSVTTTCDGNQIINNRINTSHTGAWPGDAAIEVLGSAASSALGNIISGNRVTTSNQTGSLLIQGAQGPQVSNNYFESTYTGATTTAIVDIQKTSDGTFRHNTIRWRNIGATGYGFKSDSDAATVRNVLVDNTSDTNLGAGSFSMFGQVDFTKFDSTSWTTFTPTLGAQAGTWTGGSVSVARYSIYDHTMTINFYIAGTAVSATPTYLTVLLPASKVAAAATTTALPTASDNGTATTGSLRTIANDPKIYLYRNPDLSSNWATTAASTNIGFLVSIEIQ